MQVNNDKTISLSELLTGTISSTKVSFSTETVIKWVCRKHMRVSLGSPLCLVYQVGTLKNPLGVTNSNQFSCHGCQAGTSNPALTTG